MAELGAQNQPPEIDYPTRDGRPIGESDAHRENLLMSLETLRWHFDRDPEIYVSGSLLLYYVEGDRGQYVSPDLFVVRGVHNHRRNHYLLWNEAKGPDLVIEFTSESTRHEDAQQKFSLYRDVLKVAEYFLFDPNLDYLKPPLQGYRLHGDKYQPIEPVDGRLPSDVLGLHLERQGDQLRLYDPATKSLLLTLAERVAQTESENERLRRELEQLRRTGGKP